MNEVNIYIYVYMYTNHGYLPIHVCSCVCIVCVCVCVCEYKQGLYLARDDAFNLEPHSSVPCPESWRKFTLGTREGSGHRLPCDWRECAAPSPAPDHLPPGLVTKSRQ